MVSEFLVRISSKIILPSLFTTILQLWPSITGLVGLDAMATLCIIYLERAFEEWQFCGECRLADSWCCLITSMYRYNLGLNHIEIVHFPFLFFPFYVNNWILILFKVNWRFEDARSACLRRSVRRSRSVGRTCLVPGSMEKYDTWERA